jgi:hypothetical protein
MRLGGICETLAATLFRLTGGLTPVPAGSYQRQRKRRPPGGSMATTKQTRAALSKQAAAVAQRKRTRGR